jgi:hypothetical protein
MLTSVRVIQRPSRTHQKITLVYCFIGLDVDIAFYFVFQLKWTRSSI